MGIRHANQQALFKGISFQYCTTGLAIQGGFTAVVQGASWDTCGLGIDATGTEKFGSIAVLDSSSVNSGPVIKFHDSSNDSGDRNHQVVIENLSFSGSNPIAIDFNGQIRLANAASISTWVFGNDIPGAYQSGQSSTTTRPTALLGGNGKYFTVPQPTYQNFASDQFVNVKAVPGFP